MATEQAVITAPYNKIIASLGGRKFIISLLSLIVLALLLVLDFLDKGTFQVCFMGTVAVYVAGNVAQKATAKTQKVVVDPAKVSGEYIGGLHG